MVEPVSVMNKRPDKSLFEEVALAKGILESFVEKDWFVTQVVSLLSQIQNKEFELVFTGGTALSKAHSLLKRFSEDIDFRVIASDAQRTRKNLSAFRKSVVTQLKEGGFSVDDDNVRARDENRYFSIDLNYPSYFSSELALRPHIQIEVTARNTQLPPLTRPVFSFVNELTNKPPEVAKISCIDPVESAADKLSALAWRIPDRVRGNKYDDPSLVRHLHDLAILKEYTLAHPSFIKLVINSMQNDDDRPKTNISFSKLSIAEKLQAMLNVLDSDAEYVKEYNLFVKGVSYATESEVPDFFMAVKAVRMLVDVVRK